MNIFLAVMHKRELIVVENSDVRQTADFFASENKTRQNPHLGIPEPLANRMRPRHFNEFVGQRHILSKGSLLRRTLEADRLVSLIVFGPPGTGKTTLAHCVSSMTHSCFEQVNAVASNVAELRRVMQRAVLRRKSSGQKTILFVDEIHRFSRAQQDVLMPDIENGNLTLIGATIYNPCFALTPALLSRSLIFEFRPLEVSDIVEVLERAIKDVERGFGDVLIDAEPEALRFLAQASSGDARRALNALEVAIAGQAEVFPIRFTLEDAQASIQKTAVVYDKDGDGHYDTASVFIKSMRGSDPDATLYWMAKMLSAGEDPRFIARRILVCAAEDVGNADPQALVLAQAALGALEFLGLPEARIPLAQAAVYIACAPKSNAVYLGIEKAMESVRNGCLQDVPLHLKDSHYKGAQRLERGKGYKYPHDFKGPAGKQEYMQEKQRFYEPQSSGYEKKIKERLDAQNKL
ncbi:MAG: replication-associated recombination protein A [Candidatus Omnitrophota bacterium]